MSFNSSKVGGGGLGTSTNINKSNVALLNARDENQYNSGINESGLDIENEFGYATDETEECMPLTVVLAHALNRKIADLRRDGTLWWARPDTKTQVSIHLKRNLSSLLRFNY